MNRICSSAVHTHVNDCETQKKNFLENVNGTFNIQSPSEDDHVIHRFYDRTIGHCKRALNYFRYSHNDYPGIPVASSLDDLLLVLSIYRNQYNRSTNYTQWYVRNLRRLFSYLDTEGCQCSLERGVCNRTISTCGSIDPNTTIANTPRHITTRILFTPTGENSTTFLHVIVQTLNFMTS